MLHYKTILSFESKRDIKNIKKFYRGYNLENTIRKIYKDIEKLEYMPKIHKTIIYINDLKR